jgi:hypothetical protein
VAVLGLLAVTGIHVYSRYVPFRHSPEVLAARAEEVRQRLGYAGAPVDTAYGFTTHSEYLAWVRARSAGALNWEPLRSLRPQVIVFWYRSSPRCSSHRSCRGLARSGRARPNLFPQSVRPSPVQARVTSNSIPRGA